MWGLTNSRGLIAKQPHTGLAAAAIPFHQGHHTCGQLRIGADLAQIHCQRFGVRIYDTCPTRHHILSLFLYIAEFGQKCYQRVLDVRDHKLEVRSIHKGSQAHQRGLDFAQYRLCLFDLLLTDTCFGSLCSNSLPPLSRRLLLLLLVLSVAVWPEAVRPGHTLRWLCDLATHCVNCQGMFGLTH